MYDKFAAMVNKTKNRHIPKCRPRTNRHRLPWMRSPRIQKQRTSEWQSWRRFKQMGLPHAYGVYKIERNRLCDMVRTAKMKYEGRLIAAMKENPNLYFSHCRRTLKTKQGVTNVINGVGVMTETRRRNSRSVKYVLPLSLYERGWNVSFVRLSRENAGEHHGCDSYDRNGRGKAPRTETKQSSGPRRNVRKSLRHCFNESFGNCWMKQKYRDNGKMPSLCQSTKAAQRQLWPISDRWR